MKVKNPCPEAKISQGANAQPPMIAQIACPRRMLIYRGNNTVMSFAALRLFAEMFVPIVAMKKLNAAKNAAARLSHLSIRLRGFQSVSP